MSKFLHTAFALSLVCGLAATPVQAEQALSRSATDGDLLWGDCPDFFPSGCAIAVLHGDPAQNNLDVFLRLPGQSSFPLHWHSSAERMVLVAGELHVRYQGQAMLVLKPGTYAYGPARLAHDGACASPEPCVLFVAFESPLDAIAGTP